METLHSKTQFPEKPIQSTKNEHIMSAVYIEFSFPFLVMSKDLSNKTELCMSENIQRWIEKNADKGIQTMYSNTSILLRRCECIVMSMVAIKNIYTNTKKDPPPFDKECGSNHFRISLVQKWLPLFLYKTLIWVNFHWRTWMFSLPICLEVIIREITKKFNGYRYVISKLVLFNELESRMMLYMMQ